MVAGSQTYKIPVVRLLETVDGFFARLLPEAVQFSDEADWRAKKLKDFIDNAPGKVLGNLADVCNELELPLSVRQARRLFKESTGVSINEYARKRRLVSAARQLHDTDESVKVIATDAGYHTHKAFAKSFNDMFQLRPMEFRRMWRRTQVTA